MEPITINEIVQATGGQLICGNGKDEVLDVVTDSRKIGDRLFFVPLIGERFDGHDFISQAFENGAIGCVTEKDLSIDVKEKSIIKVENTLLAFQAIARCYRNKFQIPFVGITGSVGKTTTKDMIACVLEQKFNILKTKGNFNNEIGLPLTVFRLQKKHQIGLTEMGMSGFGEISRLVSIVKPDIAVITNIGLSHIEKLGSQENILKAKLEVLEGLNKNGLVLLNGDDPLLYGLKKRLPFKTVYFGIHNKESDLLAHDIVFNDEAGSSFNICINGKKHGMHLPVMGEHNIYNALVAIAIGLEYDMEIAEIMEGLITFKAGNMRLNIFESKGIKIINDCYNASPASMNAALKILKDMKHINRKIAILGDMLEMGEWAPKAHEEVGKEVLKNKIDFLITVGYYGKSIANAAIQEGMLQEKVVHYSTNDEVTGFLDHFLQTGDCVLVKGSRGMKMETISEHIKGEK